MKYVVATAFLLCAAGAANAETFTFKSTFKVVNSISVATGSSTTAGAVFNAGDSQVTYASGPRTNKFNCASWSAPMGSEFTNYGVCTLTEGAADKASIQFSCVADAKTGAADCWGGLRGVAGRFMGKTGTLSWHQTNSADQMTGMSVGTGMWNE